MRVLFITGRELAYSRNDVLLRAFRRFAEVDALGVEQRPASLALNSLRLSLRALPRLPSRRYDLVFVGFYGHLLMLPAGLLARAPVLFDAFVSTYDTLSADRQVFSPRSPAGRLAFWLDQAACRLASHVLLDTSLHAQYFAQTFNLPADKLSDLPVGCSEDLFSPRPQPGVHPHTLVLYYSSYLPLHGVETVARAASLLTAENIHFRLIGSGPGLAAVQALATQAGLQNITFMPDVPLERLPAEIAAADVCLGGHFGSSEKAGRVVPGKVYQILAMGRPLIAGDTPANRMLLTEGEDALLCPPGDPASLAAALRSLHCDPALRSRLAAGARRLYEMACSEKVITDGLQAVCAALVGRRP